MTTTVPLRCSAFSRTPSMRATFGHATSPSPNPPPPFFTRPNLHHVHWLVLDSRHGRVLVHTMDPLALCVWNPITGAHVMVPLPVGGDPALEYGDFAGGVFCAAENCNHMDCAGAGGAFRVVFIATADVDVEEVVAWVRVYSSETGTWTEPTTIEPGALMTSSDILSPSLLLGNKMHFTLDLADRQVILEYHLLQNTLVILEAPPNGKRGFFLVSDGGRLGAAIVEDRMLCIWSRVVAEGEEWMWTKSFNLGSITPRGLGNAELKVIGYAEGAEIVFISTNNGVSMVDIKSGVITKEVSNLSCIYPVHPYATFYTLGLGAGHGGGPEAAQ